MKNFEQQKHLKPMFSQYCNDLAEVFHSSSQGPTSEDYFKYSPFKSDLDFKVLDSGLAYDDLRLPKFSPSRLDVVLEKPQSRNFSREKTQKLIYVKKSPIDKKWKKLQKDKKKTGNVNFAAMYQNKAFANLDHETSY